MEKETLFIAFSTQKGGMGKTAVTVLIASYLHYVKGYRVAIIDCDFPQHSIARERNRDSDLVMEDNYFKRAAYNQFSTLGIKAYHVKESTAADAIRDAENLMETSSKFFDIIFFDLPGTLNSSGVIKTLASMDYIFTPISADRFVLESTLQYATMLNDHIISLGKGNLKGLYLFWNMVDGREKTPLYEAYERAISELGLQILKTSLPDSKRFRKEMSSERQTIFRSTLFPPDKSLLKDSNIEELVAEICQTVKLENNGNR
ncbi:MAG: ParA family protein [Tannerella sp.]|jgi:cellulose biosynthesis protein BcsQ|nr:ParA family protein [Tannerella sp.]